jgi:hypothetical protein
MEHVIGSSTPRSSYDVHKLAHIMQVVSIPFVPSAKLQSMAFDYQYIF